MSFEQHDYLCISSGYGWGRAKTARDAYRLARANSLSTKGETFGIWRLADDTDRVEVMPDGTFNYDGPARPVRVTVVMDKCPVDGIPTLIKVPRELLPPAPVAPDEQITSIPA